MSKSSTQTAHRCSQHPRQTERRVVPARLRSRMPARLSEEVRGRIRELLLSGKYALEVVAQLTEEGISISRPSVDKEAYALQVAGLLTVSRKPREGKPHAPHQKHKPGAGRPRLADGVQGKRWSQNRDKVLALHQEDPKQSSRDIGLKLGITRQAVERILKDVRSATDKTLDSEEK